MPAKMPVDHDGSKGAGGVVAAVTRQAHVYRPILTCETPIVFTVSEAEVAAIRAAYQDGGEAAAIAEVRQLFPFITDDAEAARWMKTIAGWRPLPPAAPKGAPRRR